VKASRRKLKGLRVIGAAGRGQGSLDMLTDPAGIGRTAKVTPALRGSLSAWTFGRPRRKCRHDDHSCHPRPTGGARGRRSDRGDDREPLEQRGELPGARDPFVASFAGDPPMSLVAASLVERDGDLALALATVA
jgi:hypothetical protein